MHHPQTIVVKVGTSSLTQGTDSLSKKAMLGIARQLAVLHEKNYQVVLVTSGAVFAGREVLHTTKFDRSIPRKQMLSSVGQVKLMQIWTELFGIFGITIGQLLLTRGDFANRQRYLNVRNTLQALLQHGIVPIINENDSVAIQELRLGDNDNLSALVANLIAADLLILLTDQEGLYTADPSMDPQASLIKDVKKIDQSVFDLAGKTRKGMGFGSGGMYTKIEAASLASNSGTPTVIASSKIPTVILDLAEGKPIGTRFHPETSRKESRKRWLLSEKPQGKIVVDGRCGAETSGRGGEFVSCWNSKHHLFFPFRKGCCGPSLFKCGKSDLCGNQ